MLIPFFHLKEAFLYGPLEKWANFQK